LPEVTTIFGVSGVLGLKRFWAQNIASRAGGIRPPSSEDDLRADNVLLAALRLGVRETIDFLLTEAPSFDAFEEWCSRRTAARLIRPG
jgi:hypothetical protein